MARFLNFGTLPIIGVRIWFFVFTIGGVEDLIFGFSIGGIAAFSYETLFVNHICYCKRKKLAFEWFLLLFAVVEGLAMVVLNNILKINSIFTSSTGMILAAIIMLYIRRDLVVNALASGVLVAVVMFVIYLIPQILFPQAHYFMQRYWLLYGRPEGTLIWGHIPVTEMIWGFSWGLVWGPIYEFMVGARTMSIKRIKV